MPHGLCEVPLEAREQASYKWKFFSWGWFYDFVHLIFYFYFLKSFGCAVWHVGSLFLHEGLNLCFIEPDAES